MTLKNYHNFKNYGSSFATHSKNLWIFSYFSIHWTLPHLYFIIKKTNGIRCMNTSYCMQANKFFLYPKIKSMLTKGCLYLYNVLSIWPLLTWTFMTGWLSVHGTYVLFRAYIYKRDTAFWQASYADGHWSIWGRRVLKRIIMELLFQTI